MPRRHGTRKAKLEKAKARRRRGSKDRTPRGIRVERQPEVRLEELDR